jgi:hypothetical protein
MRLPRTAALFAFLPALALIHCGSSQTPPKSGATSIPASTEAPSTSQSAPPAGPAQDSETWLEEPSGPATAGGKGTGVREYALDVTKTTVPKAGTTGATKTKILRVVVRFPVPKVEPSGAREPHVINQLIWKVRKEIAQCFYKGPGKDVVDEQTMIGTLSIAKKGEVKDAGVESASDALKSDPGFLDCVTANVKGLDFIPAGDDVKIRYKLKLKTIDATGMPDVKAPPPDDAKK